LLRRGRTLDDDEVQGILATAHLRIDLDQRVVWRGEEQIDLSARLFDLLVYFARHPKMVLTRARLLERVWGLDYAGDIDTINVYVRWLREKIETDPAQPVLIQTVRGVGYRLND